MQLDFADVLLEVIDRRASDLHITAGAPPTVRVRGRLVPMDGFPVLTPNDTREIVYSILSEGQRQKFENNWQIDFAYQIPGRGRFRVNAYLPALRRRRRVPPDPVRRGPVRDPRPAARSSPTSPTSRAAWCSSPARRARASRPRSPR